MDLIQQFFPELSPKQISQFSAFVELLTAWNEKINLISRKNIQYIEANHLLPSLAITKLIQFKPHSQILDVGTGGGFPGIPLAIYFPNVKFKLIDSVGKKIQVIQDLINKLKLKNVRTQKIRSEALQEKFDFVIGRAVTALPRFIQWTQHCIRKNSQHTLPNGIIYLKGGDFSSELTKTQLQYTSHHLASYFNNEHCLDKCIVHLPIS